MPFGGHPPASAMFSKEEVENLKQQLKQKQTRSLRPVGKPEIRRGDSVLHMVSGCARTVSYSNYRSYHSLLLC